MTRSMFFAYERDFAARWCPVVYWDEKPSKRMEGEKERSPIYTVPPECIGEDGEPLWRKLRFLYPAPSSEQDAIDD